MEYVNASSHYERLSQRVWVNFVPGVYGNNVYKDILDGSTPYNEIVEIVSRTVFGGETPPNRILLKAKWKNSTTFHPVPHNNSPPLKLSELVKHDEKVQCEVSKIEVGLLDKKLKCLIYYFSILNNVRTNDEEIYIDKSSTVKDLINEITNKEIFKSEIENDRFALDKPVTLRVMLLEKKKNKLVARANADQTVNALSNKYKMRIEFIPDVYEADGPEETKYLPVYCIHTTRDGEIFSNPFLFFIQKNVTTLEFKMKLYEHIKDWDIWADKKITLNDEVFAKLRFVMKSEITDTKICKLETETANPFQDLDPASKKYSLEIIHPFNISNYQQMKIQIS